MATPLESLAERAQDDPFFLGCPLYWFARSESLKEEALADYLGCTRETLVKIRLCGTPEDKPPGFTRDVAAIAQRFGLNEAALAKAVRRGMAVVRMQSAGTKLMAARDRQAEEPS